MAEKLSEMSDQEIKEIMKAIARATGRPLSDERVQADLPAYKGYLRAIDQINAFNLAVEDEPASHFVLRPLGSTGKEGSR